MTNKPIGKHTVAEARDDDNAQAVVAEVTGLSARVVRSRLSDAHGVIKVRNLFREDWPWTAQALADLNVALVRRAGLHEELRRLTKSSSHLITRRINESHGKTLVRNLFSDVWPEDDDEVPPLDDIDDDGGDGMPEPDPQPQREKLDGGSEEPPLVGFSVLKGKKSLYLKDQSALDRFLLENGIEDLTVQANKGPELSGVPLFNLATRLRSMRSLVAKIDRRCDARVVTAVLRAKAMTLADFRDHATVEAAAQSLQKYLEERYPDLAPLSVNVEWEKTHDSGRLHVKFRPGASVRPAVVDWELAGSAEYQELLSIEEDIRSIGGMPYSVRGGNAAPHTLPDPEALEAFISERGRKGVQITHYKGSLGTDEEQSTGSDIEIEDTSGGITKPFDPNKIRVKLWTPTVDLVLKRLGQGEIDLAPDFQRAAGIWKDTAQSQLIESLLIRIPLPAFYVDGSDEDCLIVVDGIQRLTALRRFVLDKELTLRGLEYLTDLNGKRVDDLPRALLRRIEETMLTVYLIDKGTPEEAKLNIFKRLNTGGEPLTSQEIRHAMNPGPVRAFLRTLAESPAFLRATYWKFSDQRMTDRECALRFCAFVLTSPDDYPAHGDLDAFLHGTMKAISAMTDAQRVSLANRFDRAMTAAHATLGEHAFRKPRRKARRPVNKALFEAWAVGFDARTDNQLKRLAERGESVQQDFAKLVEENHEFEQALSQGTGDPVKVRLRFARIDELLAQEAE